MRLEGTRGGRSKTAGGSSTSASLAPSWRAQSGTAHLGVDARDGSKGGGGGGTGSGMPLGLLPGGGGGTITSGTAEVGVGIAGDVRAKVDEQKLWDCAVDAFGRGDQQRSCFARDGPHTLRVTAFDSP